MTEASKKKLNELLKAGVPMAEAMRQVREAADAYEDAPKSEPPKKKTKAEPDVPKWKGDNDGFGQIAEQIKRLGELDRGRIVPGASEHQYRLAPSVDGGTLEALEKKLGPLPPGLRAFYLQVGDGGPGPHGGVLPCAELKGRKSKKPYPGVEALREAGAEKKKQPDDQKHAWVSVTKLAGLITFNKHGSSSMSVVSNGDVGRLVQIVKGGVVETDDTLLDHYRRWLSDELGKFELVKSLGEIGAGRDQMVKAMADSLPLEKKHLARTEVDRRLESLQAL